MYYKLLITAVLGLSAYILMAQNNSETKNFEKMHSLIRTQRTTAKATMEKNDYNLIELSVNDFGFTNHVYESSSYLVEHPMLGEMDDIVAFWTKNNQVAFVYYNLSPEVGTSGTEYISEINEMEKSMLQQGFIKESVQENEYNTVKYFFNSASKTKVRLEEFYVSAILLGADIYIYESDIDISSWDE